jgi:KUP system potassium uptake protein|tara:strand:+ start:11694 stop:13682 length:1989 start_codon:yes stop_codon:yes gene_type:complete
MSSSHQHPLKFAGVLIAIGIVFGDIGTSPLYVFTAISGGTNFDELLILGSLSCIFWTLLSIATFKYIILALNADNQGEGGIFALYALLKKRKVKWVYLPALIGCATLLADGFITPSISISSAVEGLNTIYPDLPTMPIVMTIIVLLFLIQQFGTAIIGKIFGPVMVTWFLFLGLLGFMQLSNNPMVLKAINPMYAFEFLINYPHGFWVLGAVFLCTTGAEALYSDLGHCGKQNIRIAWIFVGSMLLLNYFGQAAFLLNGNIEKINLVSVFYATVPKSWVPFAIGLATLSTIIASQALITGVFTLMNEAIKLKLWTNLKVKYPSTSQGQVYVPFINYFLMVGCLVVILIFKKSTAMEASYGLAITIDMLMTSVLLGLLLLLKYPKRRPIYIGIFAVLMSIEFMFFVSNLGKIKHGGWFSLLLASAFLTLLYLYFKARQLRARITEYIPMSEVAPLIQAIKEDDKIPYEATNLVYPTRSISPLKLDSTIYHSLFKKRPKKAGIIWFLHLEITTEPWGVNYTVNEIIDKSCYFVKLSLGFKEDHKIEYMMRKIHDHLVEQKEISGESVFEPVRGKLDEVDFKFIVINTRVSMDNIITAGQMVSIKAYRFIKSTGLKAAADFGLDETNVSVEYIPINVTEKIDTTLTEVYQDYGDNVKRKKFKMPK